MTALGRFLAYYGAVFAAFGVASPFLPALLQQDGLQPGELGVVLAAGTAVRLVSGPLGGRLADRTGRAPLVLTGFTAVAALVGLAYGPARGVGLLLLVSIAHAAVLAPLTPVADALTLGSSRAGANFKYGWVRGFGSATFIGGTLLSGQMVEYLGLSIIIWLNAGLLAVASTVGWMLPNCIAGTKAPAAKLTAPAKAGAVRTLLGIPAFAWLMATAALIGGSHALHDGFEVIRWRAAGLSAQQSSLLWALSVAAEVIVFVVIGPTLLSRLGPAHSMSLAAIAGIVRWGTAAQTAWFPAMVLAEPLHGLTFALMHLTCMEVMRRIVPRPLAATAQAVYATVAMGVAGAAVTLASGPLYAWLEAGSFWFMAALCALALPTSARLRTALRSWRELPSTAGT